MPRNRCSTSIDRPDAYFDGASNLDFTTPWSLRHQAQIEQSAFEVESLPDQYLFWMHSQGEVDVSHLVVFTAESGTQAFNAPTLYQRIFCHALIDSIPEVALEESARTLKDIYDDHCMPIQRLLPPRHDRVIPAKITGSMERPAFEIDEG